MSLMSLACYCRLIETSLPVDKTKGMCRFVVARKVRPQPISEYMFFRHLDEWRSSSAENALSWRVCHDENRRTIQRRRGATALREVSGRCAADAPQAPQEHDSEGC